MQNRYKFMHPTSSKERLDGAVFRIAYERMMQQKKDDKDVRSWPSVCYLKKVKDKKVFTGFPDLSKTLKSEKHVKGYHSGAWKTFTKKKAHQANPEASQPLTTENKPEESPEKKAQKEKEQLKTFQAWSCCMNEDFNSPVWLFLFVFI